MAWQPIETAPRDGTRVLITWHDDEGWQQRAAYWDPTFESLDWDEEASEFSYRGGWTDYAVASFGYEEVQEYEPTHWQPLPAPPATTDDDAFLTRILAAAQASETVTAEDVARLRQLADWADAAPPPHWDGRMDRHETARAVEAARKRMARDA